jgi:hypothetical protein
MIIRLTAKLAKKIGRKPADCLPLDANPYLDWVGHLFTAQRTQYIIFSNTISLYSIIMFGRGITDSSKLIEQGMDNIREFMCHDGFEFIFRRLIAPHLHIKKYSKLTDKRILGSINAMVQVAKIWLIERELSPFDAAYKINEMPIGYLNYKFTKEVFAQLKPGFSFGLSSSSRAKQ